VARGGETRVVSASRLAGVGLPVAGGLLGLALVFHPILWGGPTRVPGWPDQDPRLIVFVFEHAWRWLGGDPAHATLWSPPIFFPQQGAGSYTEPLLAAAPFYWIWRSAGFAPLSAYQLWIASVFALNYGAAIGLLRWSLGTSVAASTLGAFVFAFGSSRIVTLSKAHLVPHVYLVLALVALLELFRTPPRSSSRAAPWAWIALFAVALVAQVYAAFYPFYFFGLALLAAALWTACIPSLRRAAWPTVRANGLAIVVFGTLAALAIAPLALRYIGTADEVGLRGYDATKITQYFSWSLMGRSSLLYGWLDHRPRFAPWSWSIHQNGLGFVTVLLAALGLWLARRRPFVVLLLLTTATLFVATLRLYDDVSLWRWVRVAVPGGEGLRAVARIGNLLVFPVAIGLALAFDRLATRTAAWVLASLALVCVLEQVHRDRSFDRGLLDWRVARIAAQVPAGCRAFFLASSGRGRSDADVHDDAMWVALATGIPTVNGRSGNEPPGWGLADAHVASAEERTALAERVDRWLAARGVDPGQVCRIEVDRTRERAAWIERLRAGA